MFHTARHTFGTMLSEKGVGIEVIQKLMGHTSINTTSIYIDVSDTGKGIARSEFENIFKPGYTSKKRGWGLGLTLAKRIIEEYHNGRIYIKESEIGVGTTFRIELPKIAQQ